MARKNTLDFSFSGLKTALRVYANERHPGVEDMPDLCASFQEAAVDMLMSKTGLALAASGLKRLVLAGGVAANSRLRLKAAQVAWRAGVELYLPPLALCTDNAAMVAVCGYERYMAGERDDWTLNAAANESRF